MDMRMVFVVVMFMMRPMMMGMGMNSEFDPGDVLFRSPVKMGVDFISQPQSGNRPVKNILIHTEVPKGADGHVAADSGKTIKVKNSHGNFLDGI